MRGLGRRHTPVAAPSGPSLVDCLAWFDASQLSLANGDPVVQLTDFSGQGNHALQASPGNRGTFLTPALLNGKPAVTFDGSTGFYLTSGIIPYRTFFVVLNHSDVSVFASYQRVFDQTDLVVLMTTTEGDAHHYNSGPGQSYPRHTDPTAFWINGTLSTDAAPLANYRVISGVMTASENIALHVGAFNSAIQCFYGNIAEYVLYSTVLGTTDRQAVETYLMTKYGLP